MKTWIIRLLIVAIIGGGIWWKFFRGGGEVEVTVLEPEIVTAERGDLRVVVEATGKVVANASVEVKSKASGTIRILPFEEGDRVHVGDLLVELDPDDESRNVERAESSLDSVRARLSQSQSRLSLMQSDAERALSTAEANLRQAQARYDYAEALYRRRQGLFAEGVLSDDEIESARTEYEEATAALQNAQANYDDTQSYPLNIDLARQDVLLAQVNVRDAEIQMEEAQERFEETRISSPADGVITDLQVEVGNIIASGISNVGGGTALMIISDLSRMFIEVKVDETDIGQVVVSQECEIVADAFPDRSLPGFVEWIAPQGLEENNITTFEVKVEIELEQLDEEIRSELEEGVAMDTNPANIALAQWGLRPNMTARVEIIIADLSDVVLVPNEAIQQDPRTNMRYIEVITEGASAEAPQRPQPPAHQAEAASGETPAGPPRDVAMSGQRPSGSGRPGATGGQRPSGMGSRSGAAGGGARPSGAGARPNGNGGGGFNRDMGPTDEELGIHIVEPPPTERRYVRFGVSDGIHTHVISGLEAGEEVLIPVPEWRLEFLRQQASGDDSTDNRRRRGMF